MSSQPGPCLSEREALDFKLEYSWKPFTVCGKHLNFDEHCISRLCQADCNHWGPAVYKWEGLVSDGLHGGETGVLIGETSDLRQRIKQYVSGTQECGNRFWREQLLTRGEIYLYVLDPPILRFKGPRFEWKLSDLSGANVISVKTLRDWIQDRKIDYVKAGTRVMIRPETIVNLCPRTRTLPRADESL